MIKFGQVGDSDDVSEGSVIFICLFIYKQVVSTGNAGQPVSHEPYGCSVCHVEVIDLKSQTVSQAVSHSHS